jgi:hypothetical protein
LYAFVVLSDPLYLYLGEDRASSCLDLFTTDKELAARRASEINKANEDKANEVFKQWLRNKREMEALMKKEKVGLSSY